MDMDGNTKVIISALILLVVIVGGWFITMHASPRRMNTSSENASSSNMDIVTQSSGEVSASSTKTSATSNPTAIANGESVTVANQSAGTKVMVKSVNLSQEGWVAIRDKTGVILGAALFPAGTQTNVEVPLLRATTAGSRYQVLLYYDDGNKNFNLHTETLVENADGSVAGTMFSAQ
jgi:hypothetical protein